MIVGAAPDTGVEFRTGGPVYETLDVFGVNDAGVALFGDKTTQAVPLYRLVPLTFNNLRGVTPIGTETLRKEPSPIVIRHFH